jgi:PAS domain S-box-containing protein
LFLAEKHAEELRGSYPPRNFFESYAAMRHIPFIQLRPVTRRSRLFSGQIPRRAKALLSFNLRPFLTLISLLFSPPLLALNAAAKTVAKIPMFEWIELQPWELSQQKIPGDSIVGLVFWQMYHFYVIGIVAACIVEALLIAWLLVMRKRRKRVEGELERSSAMAQAEHRRLDQVVSNVPGIVWEALIDPLTKNRRTTFISDYVEKMLGYTVEECLAVESGFGLSLIPEAEREKPRRDIETVIQSGKEGRTQHPWRTKDGRMIWVESHLTPIIDEGGSVVGLRGVSLDVTEQKLAEEALRETEAKDRAILRAIPDLMFLLTRDGTYIDCHAPDPTNLLYPPEVFLGKNMRDILPPELAKQFFDCFEKAEETGEPQNLEYSLNTKGSDRFFAARVVANGENILSIIRDVTSRRFTEGALKKNEAQLAAIIGSTMDAIITVNDDQEVILFNEAAERMFGCSAKQAVGQSLDQFIPERFREMHKQHVRLFGEANIKRRLMGERGSLCGLRSTGEEFPIEASISGMELNGRKFYTVILRDTTVRTLAEAELRASEANYRSVFNAANDAIFILDMKTGSLLDVNQRMCEMYGVSAEEIKSLTIGDLSSNEPPYTQEGALQWLQRAITGGPQLFEWHAKSKLGRLFWVEVNLKRGFLSGKDVLLAVLRDITERRGAEEALRQSEARFRNMADTAPVMIWVSDINKQITYLNQLWLDFTGQSLEHEIGEGWVKGVYPEDMEFCLGTYGLAFSRREPFRVEYRHRRRDGVYRWILGSGSPRFSSNGEFLGYIGSAIDITERKEAEEELRTAHDELHQLKNQLQEENIYLQEELQQDQSFGEIVGRSDAIKYVLFKVSQVGPTDATVLISGETGTGKELVARAIQNASARRNRPLIKVNCAALSPTLIESELFGHEKGSFTGAAARKLGRFELANGGTIFLDEIGELPLELQGKLLRVIQEGELERVGGARTIKVDVRIIAATNRDLKSAIEQGSFRQDLWYRLNVFPITVPPLRQRKEDIPIMVDHFVAKFAKRLGKKIDAVSPSSMRSLQEHWWPGNVRELANVIERAVIHSQGRVLNLADRFEQAPEVLQPETKTLEEMEREYIIRVLENTGWRIEGRFGAAKILGLNPSTLRTRMVKLQIQRRSHLSV